MTTPPVTPPTQPAPDAPIYLRTTIFGWLTAITGAALLYVERVGISPWTLGAGVFLILMGGVCIDRTPLMPFMRALANVAQAVASGISAWKHHE